MLKCNLIISVFILICIQVSLAESNKRLHNLTKIFIEQNLDTNGNLVEGFTQKISGDEIDYHSPLPQNMNALITRASDGTKRISWKSGRVSDQGKTQLVWFAGVGSNIGEVHFDLSLNDEPILSFTSASEREWSISGKHGCVLSFKANYSDAVGDIFGLMMLSLPASNPWRNERIDISVRGHRENSNAWYMTFCDEKVVESLIETNRLGFWYRLRHEYAQKKVILEMPLNQAGRSVRLTSKVSPSVNLRPAGNISFSEFPESIFTADPVDIFIDDKFFDKIPQINNGQVQDDYYDDGKFVYRTSEHTEEGRLIEVSASYLHGFVDELLELSNSEFANANLELITSSHQDIAWMDDPLACKIKRDTTILTPAMELLGKDPKYHYSAEQALMLLEYLDLHPELLPRIQQYSAQGRLEWGASFNQPYEGMYYGESLIRQFYIGRKWLKKMLPGYNPKVYFNIDVPGRTLQMPQIAKKCGVDYMIISRHGKGYFYWRSPDGSQIGVHTPGHYHHASEFLRQPVQSAIMRTPEQIDNRKSEFIKYQLPKRIPFLLSSDMSQPRDLRPLFEKWGNINIISSSTHKSAKLTLPQWRYNTFQSVLEELFTKGKNLPVLQGERPNVWLYIHGPSHHWALSASREGGRLLPVAETFNTIAAVLNEDWSIYPVIELNNAWQAQIYPDHGWGGRDGQITDALFKEKSEFSQDEAKRLIRKATKDISSHIKLDPEKGQAIVVFNPLSLKRDALLETTLKFKSGTIKNIDLFDDGGRQIQIELQAKEYDSAGFLKSVRLKAIIENLPPVGYTTLYIQDKMTNNQDNVVGPKKISEYENDFYRIKFSPGGIKEIFDKSLNRNIVSTDKFLFGELFVLKSEGNGAGEFDAPQMPTTEYFEKLSQYQPDWKQVSGSEMAKTFEIKQKLNNTTAVIRIIVFNSIKRIDFDVDLLDWNGTKSLEYRLAFPLNQGQGKITYEVPFANVTVGEDEIPGAAGERYQQIAKDLHPREVLDWISSSDEISGVTFSSDVAVWDYIDPTENPVSYSILQPVLLASRKSCHWEGNWYLQKGNHHYRFSMTSHIPGWKNGYQQAKGFNMPALVVQVGKTSDKAQLPESFSFFKISNKNVLLSTIKKAEDSDDIIVRIYETEGNDSEVNLNWFKGSVHLQKTNLIEEDYNDSNLSENAAVNVGKYAIESFKISK